MPTTMSRPGGPALGKAALVLLGLMFAFLFGRCSAPDDNDTTDVATDGEDVIETTVPTLYSPEDPPNLATERPDAMLSALRDHFHGPLTVRRVVFYPEYAWAEVQDPTDPHHLDEYDFRDGTID